MLQQLFTNRIVAGPKAMVAGCATFSAFSYVIDRICIRSLKLTDPYFTGRYDEANKVKHETKF